MILIADDFDSEINLLKEVLQNLGFGDLLCAYDGAEAIELLGKNKVRALITDFNMPYANGAEVIKVAQTKGVSKILLRSSHSVLTLRQKVGEAGLEAGFAIICKRDFDKSELEAYLKDFLDCDGDLGKMA